MTRNLSSFSLCLLLWAISLLTLCTGCRDNSGGARKTVEQGDARKTSFKTQSSDPDSLLRSAYLVVERGGRLDWAPQSDLIALDRLGQDGFYDVYSMNPDGSGSRCLTCDTKGRLPVKNKGNPSWHPSGRYIVFLAEKEKHIGNSFWSTPGLGVSCDLWVMTSDGNTFFQLTDLPKVPVGGVLHPHFSRDGQKLCWAQRLGRGGRWGEWAIQVADFRTTPRPHLENIRRFQPGKQRQFYETHGFSPDGSRILFSGNLEQGQPVTGMDIYWYDMEKGTLQNLTNSPTVWDEHAQLSPDGKSIVWMSSRGFLMNPKILGDVQEMKTELWIMNSDGTNRQRLTFFNEPGKVGYTGENLVFGDSCWRPDGSEILAYVLFHPRQQLGRLVLLRLGEVPWRPEKTYGSYPHSTP